MKIIIKFKYQLKNKKWKGRGEFNGKTVMLCVKIFLCKAKMLKGENVTLKGELDSEKI